MFKKMKINKLLLTIPFFFITETLATVTMADLSLMKMAIFLLPLMYQPLMLLGNISGK